MPEKKPTSVLMSGYERMIYTMLFPNKSMQQELRDLVKNATTETGVLMRKTSLSFMSNSADTENFKHILSLSKCSQSDYLRGALFKDIIDEMQKRANDKKAIANQILQEKLNSDLSLDSIKVLYL